MDTCHSPPEGRKKKGSRACALLPAIIVVLLFGCVHLEATALPAKLSLPSSGGGATHTPLPPEGPPPERIAENIGPPSGSWLGPVRGLTEQFRIAFAARAAVWRRVGEAASTAWRNLSNAAGRLPGAVRQALIAIGNRILAGARLLIGRIGRAL